MRGNARNHFRFGGAALLEAKREERINEDERMGVRA